MKRTLLPLLFILSLSIGVRAGTIALPDSSFGRALQNAYGTLIVSGNGITGYRLDTTRARATTNTNCYLAHYNIADITGLEYFNAICSLDLSYNKIRRLPLTHLPNGVFSLYNFAWINFSHNLIDTVAFGVDGIVIPPTMDLTYNGLHTFMVPLATTQYITQNGGNGPATGQLFLDYNNLDSTNASHMPGIPYRFQHMSHNNIGGTFVVNHVAMDIRNNHITHVIYNTGFSSYNQTLQADSNQITQLDFNVSSNRYWADGLTISHNLLDSLPDWPAGGGMFCDFIDVSYNNIRSLPDVYGLATTLNCSNNPLLTCLPALPYGNITWNFTNTAVGCIPNRYMGLDYSTCTPGIYSLPLCSYVPGGGPCSRQFSTYGLGYEDANTNCVKDSAELSVYNYSMSVYKNGSFYQRTTAPAGLYVVSLNDTGSYTVSVDTFSLGRFVHQTCPANNAFNFYLSTTDSVVMCNPGFQCTNYYDVAAQTLGYQPIAVNRPGLMSIRTGPPNYNGGGCGSNLHVPGLVKVVIDTTWCNFTPRGVSYVSGDTLVWAVSDITNGFSPWLVAQGKSSASAGHLVCLTLIVEPSIPDSNAADNVTSQCFTIINSFDPNVKEVSPAGNILPTQDWLTYTVHFQNTGSDTAYYVHVMDSIDSRHLDISTIQLLDYSSPCAMSTLPHKSWVEFDFPNIDLVDSGHNPLLSTAWFRYRIKPLANLSTGTCITNTANIYFDQNPAVNTNTTRTYVNTNAACNFSVKDTNIVIAPGTYYQGMRHRLYGPGTYIDTVSLAGGCDSIQIIHMSLNYALTPHIGIDLFGRGCVGDSLSLAYSPVATKIEWRLNGAVVATDTAGTADSIWTAAGISQYSNLDSVHLSSPGDVTVDAQGYIYVVDYYNRVIKFPPGSRSGTPGVAVAGVPNVNPGSTLNKLSYPSGVKVDSAGYIYVSDRGNNRIMRFPPNSIHGTNGTDIAGSVSNTILSSPQFVAFDAAKNLYTNCSYAPYGIRRFPPNSTSTTPSYGFAMCAANDIYIDKHGFIYAPANDRVLRFPPNSDTTTVGEIVAGGLGTGTGLNHLTNAMSVSVDEQTGTIYVLDRARIMAFPAGSSAGTYGKQIAGDTVFGWNMNQFYYPTRIHRTANGDIFVADESNQRIQQWRPKGAIRMSHIAAAAGVYTATVYAASGAILQSDSVVISASASPTVSIAANTPALCQGTAAVYTSNVGAGTGLSYHWRKNGSIVSSGNTYTDPSPHSGDSVWCIVTSAAACATPDSAVSNRLTETVNPVPHISYSSAACQGHIYQFGSHTLTQAGTYHDTLTSALGCDSIVTLTLAINPALTNSISHSMCGGSIYQFGSRTLTQAGTYRDTLAAVNSCDSIVTLTLAVNPAVTNSISHSICGGGSYQFGSRTLTQAGTYRDTLAAVNSCDSIVTLTLAVNSALTNSISHSICAGSTYTFGSHILNAAGTYHDTLTAAGGCDSIVTLSLAVNSALTNSISHSICSGSTYTFGSHILNTAGTYHDTLTAAGGCDSIVTLSLAVNSALTNSISHSICAGSTYTFGSHILNTAGTYHDTLTASGGCDSIVTLSLAVNSALTNSISHSICAGSSYTFGTHTLSAAGTYHDTLTSAAGCDSIVTLSLAINASLTNSISHSICAGNTYTFGSHILSAAGTYRDTLSASGGCDSIVTLTLAVNALPAKPTIAHSGNTLTASGTGHYQWLLNGSPVAGDTTSTITATQNGSYSVEATDANGCSNTSDTVLFAHLSITDLQADHVRIYPNPNSGSFTLETSNQIGATYIITDMLGQIVQEKVISSDIQHIDMGASAAGVYTLMLKGKTGAVRVVVR